MSGKERLMSVLLAPHVSEKAAFVSERANQFVFRVRPDATKPEIKAAVELMFEVKVDSVQVVNVEARPSVSVTARVAAPISRRRTCVWLPARPSTSPAPAADASATESGRAHMALIKTKPTSPGRRFVVKADRSHLHKGGPVAALTSSQKRTGARNNQGRLTTRHKGGGHRHRYRVVDFRRNKDGVPGKVERLEYDPNRSAHLALVLYADGERRYILAPKGLAAGDAVASGTEAPIKTGNALPLRSIPLGSTVHNVELKPGRGGQLARSAGSSAQLVAREGLYATIRLRSTEMRKVHIDCRATIGEVGNDENSLIVYGKAGAKRWRGIRPTVRGVVMNPVDHPHGGGEGKSGQGNPHPVSPWGWKTKGKKTRRNKRTAGQIVRRRN